MCLHALMYQPHFQMILPLFNAQVRILVPLCEVVITQTWPPSAHFSWKTPFSPQETGLKWLLTPTQINRLQAQERKVGSEQQDRRTHHQTSAHKHLHTNIQHSVHSHTPYRMWLLYGNQVTVVQMVCSCYP